MKNIKIAFFDAKPYDVQSFENLNNKNHNFEIKYFPNHLTKDALPLTKGYDAICIFVNDFIDKEMIDELIANGVKLIALRCAGYNNLDLKAAYQTIHVVRVPAYSPHAVSEHAVALMLTLNRKTHRAYYRTREGNFNINGLIGFDMYGKTAGIVGTGKIGKILINILKGFGMNVLAYDPYPDRVFEKESGCRYASLQEIYEAADIISLHCPLSKETYHLINRDSINRMKKGVMIINTGRGQLLNTQDLIDGLKDGKIAAAGLDVYEEETEYFFEDFSGSIIGDDVLARLLTFPNVIITSHQGFFTHEALANIAGTTLDNIKSFFDGRELINEICYRCNEKECRKELKGRCF